MGIFYFTLLKNNVLLVLNLKPFWAEKLLTWNLEILLNCSFKEACIPSKSLYFLWTWVKTFTWEIKKCSEQSSFTTSPASLRPRFNAEVAKSESLRMPIAKQLGNSTFQHLDQASGPAGIVHTRKNDYSHLQAWYRANYKPQFFSPFVYFTPK